MKGREKFLVAFDFDGTLADNLEERYLVSLRAYRALGGELQDSAKTWQGYLACLPAFSGAEDLWPIYRVLERWKGGKIQGLLEAVEREKKRAGKKELESFHAEFFRQREHLKKELGMKKWQGLYQAYREAVQAFRHFNAHPDSVAIIASKKDTRSLLQLCKVIGIPASRSRVFGKEFHTDKVRQLEEAGKRFDVPLERMVLVDDKESNLENVQEVGVKGFLPGWSREVGKKGIGVLEGNKIVSAIKAWFGKGR